MECPICNRKLQFYSLYGNNELIFGRIYKCKNENCPGVNDFYYEELRSCELRYGLPQNVCSHDGRWNIV